MIEQSPRITNNIPADKLPVRPYDLTEHILNNHEVPRLRSAEAFQTTDQLNEQVFKALDDGTINVELSDDTDALYIRVTIDEEKVQLQEGEMYPPVILGPSELSTRLSPNDAYEARMKEAEEVRKDVTLEIGSEAWWLKDEAIKNDVKNGIISQVEVIQVGDIAIPLVNFTARPIDAETIESFTQAIKRCGEATDGSAQRLIRAICIQDRSAFNGDDFMASVNAGIRIIRLSEKMFTGEFDAEVQMNKESHGVLPIDYQTVSLVHEIGHIVQSNSEGEDYQTQSVKFAKATGWGEYSKNVTDDYGSVQNVTIARRGMPGMKTMQLRGEGYEEVSVKDIMTLQDLLDAKPVNRYAETNSREDFAEAFPLYVYGAANLDPVRRNAVEYVSKTQKVKGETGEASHRSIKLAPGMFSVDPRSRTIKVRPRYNVVGLNRHAEMPEVWKANWHNTAKSIVDDYGDVVEGSDRYPYVEKTRY